MIDSLHTANYEWHELRINSLEFSPCLTQNLFQYTVYNTSSEMTTRPVFLEGNDDINNVCGLDGNG